MFVFFFVSVVIQAQSAKELYTKGTKAYEAKDYNTFLKCFQTLDSLRPFHPTYTYNLASAYSMTSNREKALETLKRLVQMNSATEFEKDTDFNYLKETGGFDNLIQLKASQNKTIANAQIVVSLSEKELHPEGLCYLKKSKTWLATSIRKRKIVAFDSKTGTCSDWLTDKTMLAVFAMKPDAKGTYLWVATAAMPEMESFSKALEGKAEILKVDIKTKKIVKRFPMEANHVFGDLVVTKNNVVYVSDSGTAMIYKIEKDEISDWLSLEKEAYNLQGITLNTDESKLFIADYLKGILMISLEKGTKKWWSFPEGAIAKGIDGMIFYKNSLIAIHNGVKPIRVIQYFLDADNQISAYKILENNRPEFNEPAQLINVGNSIYYFANCPWNAYDASFNLDTTKFENPKLFELILE